MREAKAPVFTVVGSDVGDGIRLIFKNKVFTEWSRARHAKFEYLQANGKPCDEALINNQHIDHEIDQTIVAAYDETVKRLQELTGINIEGPELT